MWGCGAIACVVLIEDDPAQRRMIAGFLQPLTALRAFGSAEEFWADEQTPDVVIADIKLPGQTGIDLARQLNARAPACQVIFISAYTYYAADVYEAAHVWFVPKDRLEEKLPHALEIALRRSKEARRRQVPLTHKGGMVLVPCAAIRYVERRLRTTLVMCAEQTYTDSQRLNAWEEILAGQPFARCHESFIVNLGSIAELRRTEVHLTGGVILPVSRKYSAALRDRFAQYLREHQ